MKSTRTGGKISWAESLFQNANKLNAIVIEISSKVRIGGDVVSLIKFQVSIINIMYI